MDGTRAGGACQEGQPHAHVVSYAARLCVVALPLSLVAALGLLLNPASVSSQIRPLELDGFIITGTPVPRTAGLVASHVSVLEGSDLRERGVTRVVDALAEVPGLVVVQNGSYGSTASTFFRGAESDHVKVLVDGVEMNQAGGAFDLSGLVVADVERIEVVRGPASALYGSDAVAGVIHVITQRGGGPLRAAISSSVGSYGRTSLGADVRGGTDRVGFSAHATREASEGILAFNNDFESLVFSGKVLARPDDATRLDFSGRYGDRTFHFPTDGSGNVVDRNAFTFGEELGLGVEVGRMFGDRVELVATLRTFRWDGGSDDRPDNPADTLGFFGYMSDDSFKRTTGDARLNVVPWRGSVLSVGAEWEEVTQESRSESFSQWGGSTGEESYGRWNRAYYGHIVTEGGGMATNLGLRYDENEQYGDFMTFQAGVSYTAPSSGTILRASLGKGLKEPTFYETASSGFSVGNPDLDPERSRVWDVGVEQPWGPSGVVTSLTWFNQDLKDLIQYTAMSPNPGDPNYFNVAEARARGLEATVMAPVGALTLTGAYTYLDSEVIDAGFDDGEGATFVEGATLIRRPKHQANLQATYPLGSVFFNGAVRWTASRTDRDFSGWPAIPVELPSYTLVDIGAETRLFAPTRGWPGLRLNVRVENLFDQSYQNVFGFDSPGRAFLVGLRAEVGG